MTEDEMVGQHHLLNGHEFEQIPGDSEGQAGMACCSAWSRRVRHNLETEQQLRQMRGILTVCLLTCDAGKD